MSKGGASCAVGLGRDTRVAATPLLGENPCNRTFGGLASAIGAVAEARERVVWERSAQTRTSWPPAAQFRPQRRLGNSSSFPSAGLTRRAEGNPAAEGAGARCRRACAVMQLQTLCR